MVGGLRTLEPPCQPVAEIEARADFYHAKFVQQADKTPLFIKDSRTAEAFGKHALYLEKALIAAL